MIITHRSLNDPLQPALFWVPFVLIQPNLDLIPHMNAPRWLILTMLVLGSQYLPSWTYGQTPLPADSIRLSVRSSSDTALAIHRLFLSERRSARTITWTGLGLAAAGVLIAQLSHSVVNSAKQLTSGTPLTEGAAMLSLKYSVPGLAFSGLGLYRRFAITGTGKRPW